VNSLKNSKCVKSQFIQGILGFGIDIALLKFITVRGSGIGKDSKIM
jgi:hypothetical protein